MPGVSTYSAVQICAATSAYFYSPEYIRLALSEQIYWLVHGKAPTFESIDDIQFARLLHQLQKEAKRQPITFLLDGLAESKHGQYGLLKEILSLFPLSQRRDFRFLISGSLTLPPRNVPLAEV